MNRAIRVGWAALLIAGVAQGQMMVLEGNGSAITTGDSLDGARTEGITTNVIEIADLVISARSGETNQEVNVTTGSLGINTDDISDATDALNAGEKLILSFSKDVRINRLDFNQFTEGESVWVSFDGEVVEIPDLELSNRISDYLDTNIVISANAEIEFYTTGASTVGLDGIDLTVLESTAELILSIVSSNGTVMGFANFETPASTNYVLEYRNDLMASNGWSTVSSPFSESTNWIVEVTNSFGFYRAIIQ